MKSTEVKNIASGDKKASLKKCYLCKETELEVTQLIVEGNRYICDNCLRDR